VTLHALSTPVTPLVGRHKELAEITQLLANPDCRLLTLVGPGGIGKTRLVLEAAVSVRGNFPDGIHVVSLQPLNSTEFMVSAIATALDFQVYQSDDPTQQLLDYLRGKSLLLVLDNMEHLLDAVQLLTDILAVSPGSRILTTSRERLNLLAEWVIDVGGLGYPSSDAETDFEDYGAVALFLQHTRRVNHNFVLNDSSKNAIGRICHLVGGMPLALELAAAWVRALPCEAIANELEHSLDILEAPTRNIEPRHRNMRVALEPTWKRLSDEERNVFKKLSVFRGGFSREAAAHIAGASLHILSGLVDHSLLRVNADWRYDVHELLRQYAEEQLNAAPEEAVQIHDLHCAYYVDFMHQQWPHLTGRNIKQALLNIENELDNVRAAWQWAVEHTKISEIDSAADSLFFFYDSRGRYYESEQAFSRAAAMLRANNAIAVLARVMVWQAWSSGDLNLNQTARTLLHESVQLARSVNAHRATALALFRLHWLLWDSSEADLDALRVNHQEYSAIFADLGDPWQISQANIIAAWLTFSDGHHQEAMQQAYQNLAYCKEIGCLAGVAHTLLFLCSFAFESGDYTQARQFAMEGYDQARDIGIAYVTAHISFRAAQATFELGDYEDAERFAYQALQIAAESGVTFYILGALVVFVKLWALWGEHERALELLYLIRYRGEKAELTTDTYLFQDFSSIETAVPEAAVEAARERSQALDLDAAVKELLTGSRTRAASSRPSDLTERELEIIHLVADGLSNREIADQLFLSVGTVKFYLNQIYGKLYVGSRTQAIAQARSLGLLP
jgi:predicted ATPase/DNA-binding CsgD family transcriptional regulator